MERKIVKMAKKTFGLEASVSVDKSGHAWLFVDGVNINLAVGRNRGYSLSGKSKDRAVHYAHDDLRRYTSRG